MEVKLIVVDMDGTLLRWDKTISVYTKDVLAKCRDVGITIALATARPYLNCVFRGFMEVTGAAGGVFSDGAHVMANGKEIFSKKIPHATVCGILDMLWDNKSCGRIIVDGPNGHFVNKCLKATTDLSSYGYSPFWHTDIFRSSVQDAYEIAVELNSIPLAQAQELAERLVAAFDDIHMTYVGGELLLITMAGVDKYSGLVRLAKHFCIDLSNVVTFGDSLNDLPMLTNIYHSVAVANAYDEAKAAARYSCPSNNEDGVARWLEENVLK
ncbi:MAG: Cof-type HAD-IIB family hydrolase [Defluviitaleaceae bacterium]|nr:Cof-type HAD-IIB family hydrolase [Defluviitaleaceae bacterium]